MITSGPMENYASGRVRYRNVSGDSYNMQRLKENARIANYWHTRQEAHNARLATDMEVGAASGATYGFFAGSKAGPVGSAFGAITGAAAGAVTGAIGWAFFESY